MKPRIHIRCSDGTVFWAKRGTLAKHSTYFRDLLTKDPKPDIIHLPNNVHSVFMCIYITAATRQGLLKKKRKGFPSIIFVNEFSPQNVLAMVEVYRLCDQFHNPELAHELTSVLLESIRDAVVLQQELGRYIERIACSFKKLLSTSPLQARLRRLIIKVICNKWDMKIFYTCSEILERHPQFAFFFAKQQGLKAMWQDPETREKVRNITAERILLEEESEEEQLEEGRWEEEESDEEELDEEESEDGSSKDKSSEEEQTPLDKGKSPMY